MERREAYRVQVGWDGTRFLLYLRSLLSGVLDSPDKLWELPISTTQTVLELPDGRREITAYSLEAKELIELLLQDSIPYPLGRDAQWTSSLISWLLSLYAAQSWYPEVHHGKISFRLLTDSVEATTGAQGFRDAMPSSLRAALPQEPVSQLWETILSSLADAVGWLLLKEEPIVLRNALVHALPTHYGSLLQEFARGADQVSDGSSFFDPRQANLSLPERNSRLAFLIMPPDSEHPYWQLRPQLAPLQGAGMCDALLGWQDPSTIPTHYLKPGTSPRFHLLREFGRALRVFPDLGGSLASSPPAPLRYNDEQMASFLKKQAEPLQAYGYPLLGPPGLERPHTPQVTLHLDPAPQNRTLDIQELLDFHWSLAVDEGLLDLKALQTWAESPNPLFFSKDRWYWVDPKTTMKALRFLQKQPRRGTLLEAMALAGGSTPLRLELSGQLSPLHQQQRFEERTESQKFQGTLRAYQRRGFSWLLFMRKLGLGACLADDMGLGKTVQTLATLLALKEEGQLERALLVCPTSVLGNWSSELQKFTPSLTVLLHHGERYRDPEQFAQALLAYDLVLTSYPLLSRDRKAFLGQEWDIVVLDEAQQIKNSQTQAAKVARSLKTRGRVILTGTPVENRLDELWSLFRFVQPELLESHRGFQKRFVRPIEKHGDAEAKDQLRRIVGPFMLRRTKTDPQIAPELPAKIESVVACSLTPEQSKLYQAEVESSLTLMRGCEESKRQGAILRLLTRLKQLCDHPALLEETPDWDEARAGKLHRLYEIFEELPKDEGILIFSQFSRMVRSLQQLLTLRLDEEVLAFDGSTPRHLRDQMVARFQSGRGPRLLVVSLKSGGVGLNLTRASTVIHYDRWWNPAVENQATDRAFRIGQSRHVGVFKFSTLGTLEEQIDRILHEKKALASGLIEDGDSWLTQLGEHELLQLLLPGQAPRSS